MAAQPIQPLDEFGEQIAAHCLDLQDTGALFDGVMKDEIDTSADECQGLHACAAVSGRVLNVHSYPFCTTNCVLLHVHSSGLTTKESIITEHDRLADEWDRDADPLTTHSNGHPKDAHLRLKLYRFAHKLIHPHGCGHHGPRERVKKPVCIMALITKLCGASGVGFKPPTVQA